MRPILAVGAVGGLLVAALCFGAGFLIGALR